MKMVSNVRSVVVITGASSGIGARLAIDYANDGYIVWACGRNQERLEALAHFNENIHTLAFDILDLQQTTKAFKSVSPRPNLWVLNAGDCEYIDNGYIDAQLAARVVSTNLIGIFNCIEASQHLYKEGDHLALVGSIASELALPRAEAYGASKAAVSYLGRTLALDLKPYGVMVSTIFPGFVSTPLTDKNTFPMPMMVSTEEASRAIRKGLQRKKTAIYFPFVFTSIIRLLALLPYGWQRSVISKLLGSH